MREQDQLEEVAASNERSLLTLTRAITLSQGQFSLILVRCNYEQCKKQMWHRLQELTSAPLRELDLQASIKTLFTTILSATAGEQTFAMSVFGLESVTAIDQVLISTNQVRDEFRRRLTFPLVLWVTDEVLQKLTRFAPDFKSWAATSIKFEVTTAQLLTLWRQTADDIFATLLRSNVGEFQSNSFLNLAPGYRRRQELESALRDLHSHEISLEPAQGATWQFILARDAFSHDQINLALEQYQQSLEFWQQELGTSYWETQGSRRRLGAIGTRQTASNSLSLTPFVPPTVQRLDSGSCLERVGILLHHIGLCYCRQAELQLAESCSKWEQAGELFIASIEVFTAAGRLDWVAQLTIQLGEVLQHLQRWTDLHALALQSLEQPETQNNPVRLAQAYGFLAAVAHAQSDWKRTETLAQTALQILEQSQPLAPQQRLVSVQPPTSVSVSQAEQSANSAANSEELGGQSAGHNPDSPLPHYRYQGLYRLLLAKAQRQLGKPSAAVTYLEQAIKVETWLPNSLQQHPQLYLDILEELRSLYLEQHQYLQAFELKQKQRSIEQQYRFCTFLGATPLQPQRQGKRILSPLEIVAAGRQPDVNRLIERLSRNDHKLTVIHGSSGVGKSSLINAGLIPALEARIIGVRKALPVVQSTYRNWSGELQRRLTEALVNSDELKVDEGLQIRRLQVDRELQSEELQAETLNEQAFNLQPSTFSPPNLPFTIPQTLQTILEQLRLCSERNLLTVLIFDQFEEFFFVCTNLKQRCQFYDFLVQCLNLPFVKVILSMREDYLHYLLECERYSNLNAINNNILDRQLRYHLGDLSPKDAKNIISTLAAVSQFQLEESLIETLVQDLAGGSGAVRLLDLQIVGAQLQAEKITTLEQYQALGTDPKASLVERSLLDVLRNCGQENEDTVWQVLFCLTDDKGTRPLKTQAELELGTGELGTSSADQRQSGLGIGKPDTGNNLTELLTSSSSQDARRLTNDWLSPIPDYQSPIDLILKILVGSGLLFRIPEEPQDQYQLVHDYLVEPIRQHYKQQAQLNIVAQLERRELEILRVQKQRLRAIAAGVAMTVLAVTAGGLGWRSEVQRRLATTLVINAQLSAISASSEALFVSGKKFDALLEGLRAARRLKQEEIAQGVGSNRFFPIAHSSSGRVEPDTQLQVITALSQAVYDASERNRLEGHSDVVWNISFSPDGQLIASASRDKTVKLWRPNGSLVTTLVGHEDSVTSLAFSPDSQLIASGSWDGTVRLWSRDGSPRGTLPGHFGHVYSVSFSPDGETLASASGDGAIRLWTIDGRLIRTFHSYDGRVQWVSFSPDGQTIAAAGEDKTIRLWTPQGKLLQTLRGHSAKVNCVVFSPNGQLIASGSDDKTVKLWNSSGQLLKTFPKHQNWVFGVAFSADGERIASASADRTVRLWHRSGTLLKTFTGHSDSVTAVSFSPTSRINSSKNPTDNGRLTTDEPLLASASLDKSIKIWGERDLSRLILRGHQDDIKDVTFSPDNQLVATASDDRTVKIWNRNGKLLNTLRGHSDRIYGVSFSPDSQLIASASQDGTVKLWSRSGILIETLKGHRDWVLNVSFSPDSQKLASASRDGTIKLWNRRGRLIKTLTGHRARVNAAKFSFDGQLLASASDDNTVKLWTADGTLLKTVWGHSNWVLDVSFSPDSQLLVSASYDNTVKLWSREGELKKTLKGHTDSVTGARFSPNGKILATTSWDNRVQLWRLDDTLIKALEVNKRRITSFSWSNDGKTLAVASDNNTVVLWNLDLDALLDKSCNWLRDYLENNPKVRPSDRNLCKRIETPKSTEQ